MWFSQYRTALGRECRCMGIIAGLQISDSAMEAEQLNQLANTLTDLRERADGLRRYL